MNFKNKWVIIAIAIVVLAIIIMISRQSEPVPVPETTTTTEFVMEPVDVLPVDGEAMDLPEGDVIPEDDVIIE